MRSKADETFVIVETLICPLHISHKLVLFLGRLYYGCSARCKIWAVIIYQYRYVGRIKLHKTSKLSDQIMANFEQISQEYGNFSLRILLLQQLETYDSGSGSG